MFAIVWVLVALFGGMLVAMGRRVYIDEEWEAGDWWAFDSHTLGRGMLFMFMFPITRTPHTREAERRNALYVMAWGAFLLLLGIALALYENSR
jgi:hypothetical protein